MSWHQAPKLQTPKSPGNSNNHYYSSSPTSPPVATLIPHPNNVVRPPPPPTLPPLPHRPRHRRRHRLASLHHPLQILALAGLPPLEDFRLPLLNPASRPASFPSAPGVARPLDRARRGPARVPRDGRSDIGAARGGCVDAPLWRRERAGDGAEGHVR